MNPLFDYYEALHHVTSHDVRGHGLSDKPATWTLEDDVEDLRALIEALELNKPVIVGFSMGSYITLATAEKYPELFSRAVLIGTKGGGSSSTQAIAESGGPDRQSAVMHNVFAPQDTPEQIAAFAKSIASPVQLTKAQHAAIYKSLADFDNLKNADKVKVPVLCLTGQYDGVNPPAKGKTVAAALPHGIFYEVPRAGHITFFENFDYTVECVDRFLEQNSGTPEG